VALAGGDFDGLFAPATHRPLYAATRGIPRDLCIVCNAALVTAYSGGSRVVDGAVLENALAGLSFKEWGDGKNPHEEEEVDDEDTQPVGAP
jgi:hypothetical protein